MFKQTILFNLAILFFIQNVHATDDIFSPTEFERAINLAGISYTYIGSNLDIAIDVNKALIAIPAMQRSGVVNPNLSQKDIQMLPISIAISIVGMFYTGGILQHIYSENNQVQALHVNASILAANEYGVVAKQTCYAFDFTRELYTKINWANFATPNLITISPNFAFSTWCKTIFAKETGAPV